MKLANKDRVRLPGYPLPLGAQLDVKGTQFSIFSRHATGVTLILFDDESPYSRFDEFLLDPGINKTGDIWHIWLEGVKEGQLYGYRIDGPYNPEKGHRFNKYKLLLDPYARAVSGNFDWNLADARGFDIHSQFKDAVYSTKDSAPGAPKCIVINHDFDWYDRPLKTPFSETIIYEAHLKGFSYHDTSNLPAEIRGTYRGLVEKIPYLKELGVTAVELLPIQEFDELENLRENPFTHEKLRNYWGYSTLSFFAPRGRYSSTGTLGEQVYEFKEMVRDFHNAGMEVILDVVFNHTAEGDQTGPTMCFRGIDNTIYYMLEENKANYKNYSGCGNTFNCNHPIVREYILACLKYWVIEMHIDGFRFDLASILGRDQNGHMLSNPPLIEALETDPILRNAKIIAEAWDAGGAYQVGHFPGRWAEWNGKFRDDVRRYWNGESNTIGSFATRLTGSSDLYAHERSPLHSINFITSHDGFPLSDLVSYNYKHNEANGENNTDGDNNNFSYNYGVEGDDVTPYLKYVREKQIKNLLTTLFVSQGVPMLLSGDEFRRTQKGNNNAYCQDNEISWLDWSFKEKNAVIFRYTKAIIAFRKKHPALRRKTFLTGSPDESSTGPDISWHGVQAYQPDWNDESHFIACVLNGEDAYEDYQHKDCDIYMAFNSSVFNYNVTLPAAPGGGAWHRVIDTSLESPEDIIENEDNAPTVNGDRYFIKRRSTVILIAKPA